VTNERVIERLPGIESLLRRRGAWFSEEGTDLAEARARDAATVAVAAAFPVFERIRDVVMGRDDDALGDRAARELSATLLRAGVVDVDADGLFSPTASTDRYLCGGWLEEHVGLSALEGGADEVRIGQKIGWTAAGFRGENEIDTIARFGERLVFVSAKGFRSRLEDGDVRHRERLMDALQEADNLVDHFGDSDSAVALVVSTDLWDERAHRPRYEQLHGKAAALGVALVTLELIERGALAERLRRLGKGRSR
jgi:hypothetical protein